MTDGLTRNVALFDTVAALIEQFPERYDQYTYGSGDDDVEVTLADGRSFLCNSRQCIAGWAAWVDHKPGDVNPWYTDVDIVARDLLGIGEREANILFGESWLPEGVDEDSSSDAIATAVANELRAIGRGKDIIT